MKINPTAEQRRYWSIISELGCIVTGRQYDTTIHHVHGGSMTPLVGLKGMALKANNWLVIPLNAQLHNIGPLGIDSGYGVQSWERRFGTQLYHLVRLVQKTGINVFEKVGLELPVNAQKYPE